MSENAPYQVDVNLYNPKVHANIIQIAYGSFKLSEAYALYLDSSAEDERESCRQIMKIQDVTQTHSRPYRNSTSMLFMFHDDSETFCPC